MVTNVIVGFVYLSINQTDLFVRWQSNGGVIFKNTAYIIIYLPIYD